ncbi:MAG: hypothetical protein GWP08_07485 [Nitrospiraceae bacterium]|nr:hypothetical protein [Nitrospiraceae bacterium]
MAARVPGEIHLDLISAGDMEEPLVSLNAKKSRWVEKRSWWYVKTFRVTASLLRHERQELVFDGLDLYAQVFLNGELLGEAMNAFVPHVFDVRSLLIKGENTLAVRLTAGAELVPRALQPKGGNTKKAYVGRRAFPGINHLRKPQFTYGWDWVDALPNVGIWRGVRLEAFSGVVLHDLSLNTRIRGAEVFLDVCAVVENLHPWRERAGELVLDIKPPRGRTIRRRLSFRAQVGRQTVLAEVAIAKPQLWWPNGMGEQPLYRVVAEVFVDGELCDRRELEIGLRTIELDRAPSPSGGSRFSIRVNGQAVFCKGGNWIPADAIIARVSPRKYRTLVAEAKNANMNMLRVWGGGIYESPEFYEACDRAGMLVWQDFMFACARYPDRDPEFRNLVRAEAEAVIPKLRHHPCIVLWCGNNENILGFAEWWNSGKDIGDKDLRVGGSIIYNQVLPDVCRSLDPDRPYWPGSPAGGDVPNSETDGDCHWWVPFTMNQDVNRRISHEVFDECRSRFVSEYGVIGPCHPDSVKQYLKPEERRLDSRAWEEHTNAFENATIPAAIQRHYADVPELDIAARTLYAQLFQASMYGRTIEALRFRKNDPRDDCQGALIWMYNDCWGETGWTPIDYYLRRKPSYYWIRNACAPVKAIVRRRKKALVTRVVNDTLDGRKVEVHYGWMRVDGTDERMQAKAVSLPANGVLEIGGEPISTAAKLNLRQWIYTAYLTGDGIEACPSIWLPMPHRELALAEPDILVTKRRHRIQLVSSVYCHAVHCEDKGRPLLSDNYFDLLPGVPKTVEVLTSKNAENLHFHAVT